MRPRFFGQYLLSRGVITAPQLLAAVEYQNKHRSKLGQVATALGLVTPFDAERIHALQFEQDLLFGEAAIRLGLLSAEQLDHVLTTQQDSQVLLGQALEQLGYLDAHSRDAALVDYAIALRNSEPVFITIPTDLPERDTVFMLLALAPKLLMRAWGVQCKTDKLRVVDGPAVLSDVNAVVQLSGALSARLIVAAPYAVTEKLIAAADPSSSLDQQDANGLVCELANVLAAHVISLLAEQSRRVFGAKATVIESRISLAPGACLALASYLTHSGQIHVGLLVE
jgi:CheY-specific phosphatase CheX